jgi:hypothetical protein
VPKAAALEITVPPEGRNPAGSNRRVKIGHGRRLSSVEEQQLMDFISFHYADGNLLASILPLWFGLSTDARDEIRRTAWGLFADSYCKPNESGRFNPTPTVARAMVRHAGLRVIQGGAR